MENVTLVPVALLAVVVVLGNLRISLIPNKRDLQLHSKGRGVGTCHIPCKVLRRQDNSYKNKYGLKMESSVLIKLD